VGGAPPRRVRGAAALSAPLVTIGVVSYNRLHYLRALLESARECVLYPNLQWIVMDGDSREPGLREYVESLDFVEHKVFEECGAVDAMNRIVELARGEYLMMLPEDVQFIVRGSWLADMVELVREHPRVGQVNFDAQRRLTLRRHFHQAFIRIRGRSLRVPVLRRPHRRYRTASGALFLGYGRAREPVGGAGILTFVRTEIRRRLGPWRANPAQAKMDDSGLGAEDDMVARHRSSGRALEAFLMRQPAVADIVTDPRGTKARIRFGNRRYGLYRPPPQGPLYYRIWEQAELERFAQLRPAPAFEDLVVPVGFDLPLDEHGNLRKVNVISEHEPYELVEGASPR
jgi:glycosyltransferase involved in cell wall biosynthesis